MGSNKKTKDGLSRRKASSRVKTLLSDFGPSNALSLFFPRDVRALLPSDADMQQQYTLKHIRKYVCALLVGVSSLGGMSGESWGNLPHQHEERTGSPGYVQAMITKFSSPAHPSAPPQQLSRSPSSSSLYNEPAGLYGPPLAYSPYQDPHAINHSNHPIGGQAALRDAQGPFPAVQQINTNPLGSPTQLTHIPPSTSSTTVQVYNGSGSPTGMRPYSFQVKEEAERRRVSSIIEQENNQAKFEELEKKIENTLTGKGIRLHEPREWLTFWRQGAAIITPEEAVDFLVVCSTLQNNQTMPPEKQDLLKGLLLVAPQIIKKWYYKYGSDKAFLYVSQLSLKIQNKTLESSDKLSHENPTDYLGNLIYYQNHSQKLLYSQSSLVKLLREMGSHSLLAPLKRARAIRLISQSGIFENQMMWDLSFEGTGIGKKIKQTKHKELKRLQKPKKDKKIKKSVRTPAA